MPRSYRQLAFNIEAAATRPIEGDALAAFFAAWKADNVDAMPQAEYGEWLNARPREQFVAMMTWYFQEEAKETAQGATA